MNNRIRRLGLVIFVLFAVLFAQLNRLQVFGATELRESPTNTRPLVADFGAFRGEIRSDDGTVLAVSEPLDDGRFEHRRRYPLGALAAEVTGFVSFQSGNDGLEASMNDLLQADTQGASAALATLLGAEDSAAHVQTTLSISLQEVARELLGERRGSVVILDAQSGAIKTLFSWPTYDPNPLADTDGAAAAQARQALLADPARPLLPRTYREVFFPGSTFKLVAAAAALEERVVSLDEPVFAEVDTYTPPLTDRALTNFGGSTCGGPLSDLIRSSCNTGFAQLAVELLGPDALIDVAEAIGFNDELDVELPNVAASTVPTDFGPALGGDVELSVELAGQLDGPGTVELTGDIPRLAQVALGQNDVQATPLQMALVAASIANDGVVPSLNIVSHTIDAGGRETNVFDLDPAGRAFSRETAADLRLAMLGVVEDGTGQAMAIDGLVVGAKTGTAQLGPESTSQHAWAVAFAGTDIGRPDIAIAVLVEADETAGEQTGGRVAGPVVARLIEAWAEQ